MMFFMSAVYHANNQVFVRPPELDLANGNTYEIEVTQKMFGRIQVQAVHGFEHKPIDGSRMIYPSLFHFFKDWEPKQVAGRPGYFQEGA